MDGRNEINSRVYRTERTRAEVTQVDDAPRLDEEVARAVVSELEPGDALEVVPVRLAAVQPRRRRRGRRRFDRGDLPRSLLALLFALALRRRARLRLRERRRRRRAVAVGRFRRRRV